MLTYHKDFNMFLEKNDDLLMEYWEEYKYDKLCGEYFHHDDVDYFNEDFFNDMASGLHFDIEKETIEENLYNNFYDVYKTGNSLGYNRPDFDKLLKLMKIDRYPPPVASFLYVMGADIKDIKTLYEPLKTTSNYLKKSFNTGEYFRLPEVKYRRRYRRPIATLVYLQKMPIENMLDEHFTLHKLLFKIGILNGAKKLTPLGTKTMNYIEKLTSVGKFYV